MGYCLSAVIRSSSMSSTRTHGLLRASPVSPMRQAIEAGRLPQARSSHCLVPPSGRRSPRTCNLAACRCGSTASPPGYCTFPKIRFTPLSRSELLVYLKQVLSSTITAQTCRHLPCRLLLLHLASSRWIHPVRARPPSSIRMVRSTATSTPPHPVPPLPCTSPEPVRCSHRLRMAALVPARPNPCCRFRDRSIYNSWSRHTSEMRRVSYRVWFR